jgi:hypothetical protein
MISNFFNTNLWRQAVPALTAEQEALSRASVVPLQAAQAARLQALMVEPGSFAPRKTLIKLGAAVGTAVQEVAGAAAAAGVVSWGSSRWSGDTSVSQYGAAQATVTALTDAITDLVKRAVQIASSGSRLSEVDA